MATQIYVNLPVEDLSKSTAFFRSLGFEFNPQFTNESGAGMIVSGDIYVMLLTKPFFQTFTKKPICDAKNATEVLVCLSLESRAKVDEIVEKAVAAGGKVAREPQIHDFMYGQSIEDLDGHIWEFVTMTPPAG